MDKEDTVYIHSETLLSHKKERNSATATTWMDLENIMLSDIKQKTTKIFDITYVWNLKINKRIYIAKQKDSQIQKTN